jgi:ABC-type lipoprotein export system ATPase subunit
MLFKIKNLYCAYDSAHTVLKIEELVLPREKLIFFVGLSGVGKSTLIESLGLMSRTIQPRTDTVLTFQSELGETHDLTQLWEDAELLSEFRRKYFSFIFQTNNLMPHFTAGQNMCLTQLLDADAPYATAKSSVLQAMQHLSLAPELFGRNVTALSGGQRQRLAFVRAITAPFEVLFGDEPTGNLDRVTAEKLMQQLKEAIATRQKSGIVVSHDLGLADLFADMVVVITPTLMDSGKVGGVVHEDNVFYKKQAHWEDQKGQSIDDFSEHLYTILKAYETSVAN